MRYKIVDGSESGHSCCFDFTIIDSEKIAHRFKSFMNDEEVIRYENICECSDKKSATLICKLLNKHNKQMKN